MSTTTNSIEAAIVAAGADKAPRVTPADVEAAIASEFYFRASEGAKHPDHVELHNGPVGGKLGTARPLELLTIAVLVLRNGFTVVGTSACASPENFDAEIGRRVARADAVRQVWPLLGYALRDRLAGLSAPVGNPALDAILRELNAAHAGGETPAAG